MSDVDLRNLFKNKFTIGVDVSVAAGPVGREASADTDISFSSGILSYSRARGLSAGLTIQGAGLYRLIGRPTNLIMVQMSQSLIYFFTNRENFLPLL